MKIMRKIKLAVIAKLPTYIAWCEKKYPSFQLEWFKSLQEYEAQKPAPNGYVKIILSETPMDTDYPCIDLSNINVHQDSQKLERYIDNLVLYQTLSGMVRHSPSEIPPLV